MTAGFFSFNSANGIMFFPLQSIDNFALNDIPFSLTDFLIGISIIAAIIIAVVILNAIKKPPVSSSAKGKASGGMSGLFSGFAFRRIARNLGLNHEQTKMLDYVFKLDGVTDIERSINTPSLLDRHFRRAYRVFDQSGQEKESQHKLSILFSTRNILENSVIGGITSTQQLRENITFIVSFGKEKYNINVLSTKGDNIIVEAPKNVLGSLIKIPKGTRLTVMFFSRNNKGFSFETRVVGFTGRDGHPAMQLAHSNQLRFLSQRRFRRRQTSIACILFLVYVEGSGKKQKLLVDKRRLQGNIADISVGGCSIKIMTPVKVGARFKIEFTQGDEKVAALGKVLRSNRTGAATVFHVRFLRVSQKSMNTINAFVYEYGSE